MPIRRGEEYLESLRDGRCVWLMGQQVEDVTTHPALAGCARSVAAVYDLQHDPTHQDLLTMPSPTTGERVSLAYLLPHSVDELARQRPMYEFLVRRTGGVAARLPQHLATVVIGLYDVRDLLVRRTRPPPPTSPATLRIAASRMLVSPLFSPIRCITGTTPRPIRSTYRW